VGVRLTGTKKTIADISLQITAKAAKRAGGHCRDLGDPVGRLRVRWRRQRMRDFLAWCAKAGMPSIDAGPMSRMPHSADLLVYRWERCVEIQRHGPEGATLRPSLH
jgi:hypothetical protein